MSETKITPFDNSLQYKKIYQPDTIKDENLLTVFKYQESLRIKEAKEYRDFIENQTKDVEEIKTPNVRRIVKDIWMWPLKGYLPWNKLNDEQSQKVILIANKILSNIQAKPNLVDGKIYLTLCGFRSELWKECKINNIELGMLIPNLIRPLTENIETEHITVVNSDIVSKFDQKEILDFIHDQNDIAYSMNCNMLQHTLSLDWARFGICLVVGIECLMLNKFIEQFNKKFNTSIKINSHITIAIDSRV